MAVNPIYRESWQKANGWNVRTEFIAGGGEASKHGDRTVTSINGVFKDVSGHKAGFGDGIPFGLADSESCKFVIDYSSAPAGMQSALVAQFATVADGNFATLTTNKYRTPTYMPEAVSSDKPKQPNLFMVWSDRGSSNGVVTGLSIAYGGTAWGASGTGTATEPYFPAPMDSRIGSGLTVNWTATAGEITSVSVNAGGTGYKVGQQVKIEDALVSGRYAYFTVTSVQTPTWYIEFMGCQRISPSTKYKVDERGMEIEIEAIGIHKIALESITDLSTYTRSYISSRQDSTVGGNYYHAARSTTNIVDFDYGYDATRYKMYSMSPLLHWHAPLGSIFTYMQDAFDEAFEFYSMEGYQGASDNSTNIGDIYPTTSSKIKLMRQKVLTVGGGNVGLGETNGTLHDTDAELTEIRFIFCVTRDARQDFTSADSWVGGLFTDFEDGIRKDCDSAWDLLRKLSEQFFLKVTPYYEFTSGLMKANWNVTEPYGSISGYGVPTLAYNDTVGQAAFETNAETRETIKQHHYVNGSDVETVEVTSFTKSGKCIESNHIFDIRIRTAPDGTPFTYVYTPFLEKNIQMPYARLRGLYSMANTLYGAKPKDLLAVSPRIDVTWINILGLTGHIVTDNVYVRTTDKTNPNYVLHEPLPGTSYVDIYMIRIRELQESPNNGFGYLALLLSTYFGVGSEKYFFTSSNNQASYEMQLPISTSRLPERIGQRCDITPHSAMTTSISEKAYLMDLEIDWTARDAISDMVKAKYLTRSIIYD